MTFWSVLISELETWVELSGQANSIIGFDQRAEHSTQMLPHLLAVTTIKVVWKPCAEAVKGPWGCHKYGRLETG